MPKLTDDEVGQLLRETFAEKEVLVDQLPEATTSPARRKAPVLLAAAAVIVVLAGVLSIAGVQHNSDSKASQNQAGDAGDKPASRQTVNTGSKTYAGQPGFDLNVIEHLSGLAITELTKAEQPAGGWPVLKVLDSYYPSAGSPTGPGTAIRAFTAKERGLIQSYTAAPIEWVKNRPTGPNVCDQAATGAPYVTVGRVIFDKNVSSATIGMSVWRGCLDGRWLTYRLERSTAEASQSSGSAWHITGTVGPVAMS